MNKRHIALPLIAILLVSLALPATAQVTLPTPVIAPSSGITVPVSGVVRGAGRVSGTFTVLQFLENPDVASPDRILAAGKLQLALPDGRSVSTTAAMPVKLPSNIQVASATTTTVGGLIQLVQAACDVLDLTLGPLDLNLLGLEIHLDTVHLVIEANPAGGLLGQLLSALCQPATPNPLATIINLLNQILAALNALNTL